ncbi:hypothetical protein [Pontiella sulfatireligans]|uniref:Alginate lyase domain-containing protein n=1 Tax=Pontiella sulfatireligans TaxID=2750658 RepID=A0A6C2UTH8_9BACT|nr:hypothetical protein [Pontiella sulfatireligans]VGO22216.1 hypothetical protein SCARR_04298 [Pontiella sulfatireligans]
MRTLKALLVVVCCMVYAGLVDAATLKDKPPTIFYPEGHYLEGWPRTVCRDMFGYNYQTHMFKGSYANVYLGGDGFPPYMGNTEMYYLAMVEYGYADTIEDAEAMLSELWYWGARDLDLYMKWNDAWLSNQDRGDDSQGTEPDGNLDRHYGYASYFDSGAALINIQSQTYEIEIDGKTQLVREYYYLKLKAVTSTDVLVDGIWYTEGGDEIGPEIYGAFAIVKEEFYGPYPAGKPGHGKPGHGKPNHGWGKGNCQAGMPDMCTTKEHSWKKPAKKSGKKTVKQSDGQNNRSRGRR